MSVLIQCSASATTYTQSNDNNRIHAIENTIARISISSIAIPEAMTAIPTPPRAVAVIISHDVRYGGDVAMQPTLRVISGL